MSPGSSRPAGPGASSEPFWRPGAGLDTLRVRTELARRVRRFFDHCGVLEVDTPSLARGAVTDPNLHSLATDYHGPGGGRLYLHTSPEFFMKRLLAAGSGSIWQLCKVYRDGEAGRRHNPEFSLLEWYRVGFDHHRLMDEVESLISCLLDGFRSLAPAECHSYRELFRRYLGLDPFTATPADLRRRALEQGIGIPPGMPPDDTDPWLDLLLSHRIEPRLGQGRLDFIYDYPPSQAALARIRHDSDGPPVGERFEVYLDGVELANGFHELGDAGEQRRRFDEDNRRRRALGVAPMPLDEAFLAALAAGLPDCAGVALGFDRLVMLAAGLDDLDQAMAFSVGRV